LHQETPESSLSGDLHTLAPVVDGILIIDADPSVRGIMAQLLHLEGFAPFTAANSVEAFEFLRAGGPAKVVMLDLMLPVRDGWTLCREQRTNPSYAELPVVVLTRAEGGLDVAASFHKPLDFPRVVTFIRDLCRRTEDTPVDHR
jgi:DNA-binding response OmpR family regulator